MNKIMNRIKLLVIVPLTCIVINIDMQLYRSIPDVIKYGGMDIVGFIYIYCILSIISYMCIDAVLCILKEEFHDTDRD